MGKEVHAPREQIIRESIEVILDLDFTCKKVDGCPQNCVVAMRDHDCIRRMKEVVCFINYLTDYMIRISISFLLHLPHRDVHLESLETLHHLITHIRVQSEYLL